MPSTVPLVVVLPARRQLLQRNQVRRISVDLVRRQVHEGRLGAEPSDRLEKVQGAGGVDVEVVERPARGQVVARLRGRVEHGVRTKLADEIQHTGPIPNVQLVMREAAILRRQPRLVPPRVTLRPEEIRPHVVVHPMDLPPEPMKVLDHLGANQAVGARYQYCFHASCCL